MVLEELDPVIERELIYLCGKHHLDVKISGKINGSVQLAGENTVESVKRFSEIIWASRTRRRVFSGRGPALPVRPLSCVQAVPQSLVLCREDGCQSKKAVFSGDIGCYTLGNAKPLDMVDTCLCMGADVTIAQGIHRVEPTR
jgi:indolepyruvate ferredoxin oxidoreductase alpha subunit